MIPRMSTRWGLLLCACILILVRAEISRDYKPKAGKPPSQWPPRIPVMMNHITIAGHYLKKNFRTRNAANRNMRDGMYHYDFSHTFARTVHPFDEGLTLIRNKDVVSLKRGLSDFCPPQKLGNLRHKIMFFEKFGLFGDGSCTVDSIFLNLHKSRVDHVLMSVRWTGPYIVGSFTQTISEGDFFWKSKKMRFTCPEITIDTELALGHLVKQSRPFEFSAAKGPRRKLYGTSTYVEFNTNRIDSFFWGFGYIFNLFTNGALNFITLYLTIEFLPHFSPRFMSKIPGFSFSGKKIKRVPFKVQEAVNLMELLPNALLLVGSLIHATSSFSLMKASPWGTYVGTALFFNQAYKLMSLCTTLLMTGMWMNESAAAAKMKAAPPILQSFGKSIAFGSVFWLFCEFCIWRGTYAMYGDFIFIFTILFLIYTVMPVVTLAVSFFFQFEAGQVAASLGGGDENAALTEFRNKMILNLARAGIVEILGIIFLLVTFSLPVDTKWMSVLTVPFTIFRNGVPYFQIVSIEPASCAKARKNKRKKAAAAITSRVSMTSTSSMSSTSIDSSISSTSDNSSESTAQSTAMSTTA